MTTPFERFDRAATVACAAEPDTLEDLRIRLEGKLEVLERAALAYPALIKALSSGRRCVETDLGAVRPAA